MAKLIGQKSESVTSIKAGTNCPSLRLIWLACVLTLATLSAHAQEEPVALPAVRVSASTLPITISTPSQHVSVIGPDDLRSMRQLSVAEILSRQAGLMTDRSATNGGFGSLYLRGADPSHVVILVDHIRLNDPLSSRGSAVDLSTLSGEDIERIEIVRGNVSVAHAEALAGVVHILTRQDRNVRSASAGAGGQGLRNASVSIAQGDWQMSGSHGERGERETGFTRNQALNLGWTTRLDRGAQISANARISESLNLAFPDDSGGIEKSVRRTLESRHAYTNQLSAQALIPSQAFGDIEIQLSHLSRTNDENSPGVAPGIRDAAGLPRIISASDYQRQELQLLSHRQVSAQTHITAGFEFRQESGQLNSRIFFTGFTVPARFKMNRDVAALLLEAQHRTGNWTWQAGIRHESASAASATNQPMLSVRHVPDGQTWHWGASISSAQKLPSFYALGHPLVGNAGLQPEKASQREIYWANQEQTAWPTRITLFHARYRNLIDFDSGPPPRMVNRDNIVSDGIEWKVAHQWQSGVRVQLDGSLMNVRDPAGVTTLRMRPHMQWGVQMSAPLSHQLQASASLRHVTQRLDSSIATGDQWLEPITLLNLACSMPLSSVKDTRLNLAIDNLLNSRSHEVIGTPVNSRTLRVSLSWRAS